MTRTFSRTRRRAGIASGAAILGVAAMVLTGCSGASSSAGVAEAGQAAAPAHASAQASPSSAAGGAKSSAASDVVTRQLARQATMAITVDSVGPAAAKVDAVASSVEGYVVDQNVQTDPYTPVSASSGPAGQTGPNGEYAVVTVSVPASMLGATVTALGRLGKVTDQTTTTTDVTGRVIDTASRLKTLRASVARVRTLMGRATKISDVVPIESSLSTREADLESLEASSASLAGSVARSQLTVTLASRSHPATVASHQPPAGFFGGLAKGWSSFVLALAALLTLLGVVLPYLVTLAILTGGYLLILRRRRATRHAPEPAKS